MENLVIGVPRALLYYKQFPFWQTFFETLGVKTIVSPKTNTKILNLGLETAVSEVCLPVKTFFGHAMLLKKSCDYVFVPRVVSVEKKTYTCPKFLGLPDMLRALPNAPKILSVEINARKRWGDFYKSLYGLALKFTKNPLTINTAFFAAKKALGEFNQSKLEGKLGVGVLKRRSGKAKGENCLKIGIIGHTYNVYDSHINLNFIERIRKKGVGIISSENIHPKEISKQAGSLSKSIFWSYEKEVVGAALHWFENRAVDGIIYLLAFACGPDSLMQLVIEDRARRHQGTPLISLVIDEHSGEAGFLTRLEAFIDMLKYKKAKAASIT